MKNDTFMDYARLFKCSRELFIERLRENDEWREEILQGVRTAINKGTFEEYRNAIVGYLNAMIDDDEEVFKLIADLSGEDLLEKIISVGLRRIS